MIIDFVTRLLQLSGIVTAMIVFMLVASIMTQDQWKVLRHHAKVSGWRKAITNEIMWSKRERLRIRKRYEYDPK